MSRPVAELHADWLRLVEPEGQFLSLPVLRRAFSSGLNAVPLSLRAVLSETFPRVPRGATPDENQWSAWLEWLLRDVLAWGPAYRTGDDAAIFSHAVPERDVVLRADGALVDPETERVRVLIVRYPHGTPLDRRLTGERWNASPLDRLTLLCRAHAVRIGLLTDGERILLAWIPNQGPGGHAIWETGLFTESRERNLLQSFISLLHASRFFAVREGDQLESLFEESARAESDVTDRLGFQVRQAVELLVAALSRADLESNGALLARIAPQRVYEAAATVMMRLVFLLFAEERDLLPLDDPLYADSYAASTLREQLDEQAIVEGDEPLERRSAAWFRLLALFRAVYAGLDHDRLRILPYGGRLFDPDRFPFLEGRTADEGWSEVASRPLPIDDLTVRAILEALQTLPIREGGSRERRRLSFRALDVEQIGHVYEGLLDHGAVRVDDVYVGLVGKSGDEAEIPLVDLEQKAREGEQPLVSFLHDFTGKSEGAIAQLVERGRAVAHGRDPDARRLIYTSCENDAALAGRVSPFFYALRRDLHDLPVVFPPQSLVVKQTRQRRSAGTEYTPRDLAEEMVRYALEPLVYAPGPRDGVGPEQWRLRPSNEILDLKICDPAVGSGAFLVSACRYLADLVVEAWIAEDPNRAQGDREDLTLEARRAVVDRCLYGVDRDAMAIEMAKLSLWLVTMARERPFSFLDHAIRCGDSLLGITSLDQLRYLHIDPEAGRRVHTSLFDVMGLVQPVINAAVTLRVRLEAIPTIGIRDADEKRKLSEEADRLLDVVTLIADGVVATALTTAGRPEGIRDSAFQGLALLVARCLDPEISEVKKLEAIERLCARNEQLMNAGRPNAAPTRTAFHWPLVFPEVFHRGGFDVIVGNPPFTGGTMISGLLGEDYRQFITRDVAGIKRSGRSDLCAFFILRALNVAERCGLIACDSIAEGDTRKIVLDRLPALSKRLARAVKSVPWPGKAGTDISKLWIVPAASQEPSVLNGEPVIAISSSLTGTRNERLPPEKLSDFPCFACKGSDLGGQDFVLATSDATRMLQDVRNAEVVLPFLGAADICDSPTISASRYVINFHDWPESVAQTFDEPYRHILEKVKPVRQRRDESGHFVLRGRLPELWWRYNRERKELYSLIQAGRSAIVLPRNPSKYLMPVMVSTRVVFADSLFVLASDDYALFSILTSDIHRSWVLAWGGTLNIMIMYPTRCFVSYPFPSRHDSLLSKLGERLNDFRSRLMRDNQMGITDLYNDVHDPSNFAEHVVSLRGMHEEIDQRVLAVYGWTDIQPVWDFRLTSQGLRYTLDDKARGTILDRLLELNHLHHQQKIETGTIRDAVTPNLHRRRANRGIPSSGLQIPMIEQA
jgi:hypothetical protein